MAKKRCLDVEERKLVEDNIRLVHHIVKTKFRMKPNYQDYYDYVQEGCLALCTAVINFKPELGFKLATYASSIIWGSLMRYKRDYCSSLIKYPREVKDTRYKIAVYMSEHPEASINELADNLNLSTRQIFDASHNIISFDDMRIINKDGDKLDPYEFIADPNEVSLEARYELFQIYDDIDKFIDKTDFTSNVAKEIFTEYIYDIIYLDKGRTTQAALADKYNISQSYASRIISNYMKKLRKFIKDYKS